MENSLELTQRDLLARIAKKPVLNGYYLAGGTALNLQLRHRVSMDLDFFSDKPLEDDVILNVLKQDTDVTVEGSNPGTFHLTMNGIPVSFFKYECKVLEKIKVRDVVMASLKDIGLMKIMAIMSRGLRKDFIDLYAICRTGLTMPGLMGLIEEKYPGLKVDKMAVVKALVYFNDAMDEVPLLAKDIDWEKVKRFFRDEARNMRT